MHMYICPWNFRRTGLTRRNEDFRMHAVEIDADALTPYGDPVTDRHRWWMTIGKCGQFPVVFLAGGAERLR